MNKGLVRGYVVTLKTLLPLWGTGVSNVTGIRFPYMAKRRVGIIFKTRICAKISCFRLNNQYVVHIPSDVGNRQLNSVEVRYAVMKKLVRELRRALSAGNRVVAGEVRKTTTALLSTFIVLACASKSQWH